MIFFEYSTSHRRLGTKERIPTKISALAFVGMRAERSFQTYEARSEPSLADFHLGIPIIEY